MDQRADGRGALHRIREPGVQRELRGLPDGPAEQEEGDQGEQLGVQQADPWGDLIEPERAELVPDDEDGDEEEDVSHTGHKERLLRGSRRFRLVVPKSDQQIRAEAHDLPENQELQEVVRAYSAEHPRREQTHLGVVARLALLLVHVSERINKNQETEERHEDKQDRKSTRLNSSHSQISYAVFCLKKNKHTYIYLFLHAPLALIVLSLRLDHDSAPIRNSVQSVDAVAGLVITLACVTRKATDIHVR